MSKVALGLCALLVVGGLCAAQEATPLDPQAVLQEMSARMLALDSFHQAGQLSATFTMGQMGPTPLVFALETWYEKPNKLALTWANTAMIFDGTYGYFYMAGSPVAYRWPATSLPPGWEQWVTQPMTQEMTPSYYPPEIMQWLAQGASAYASGDEIHVIFSLTGEQLMQVMAAMGEGLPGLSGMPGVPEVEGAEGTPDLAQALSQILAFMEMRWDVALDASTYLLRYMQGQIGMPSFGVSTDFWLQFSVSEQNIAVPPEVFVFTPPPGVEIQEGLPPFLGIEGAPEAVTPPEETAPPEEGVPSEETVPFEEIVPPGEY